jgi:hypothetical protein
MSSARFATPLTVELKPSRLLTIAGASGHLLALACLAACQLPFGISVTLGALIAASFGYVASWHLGLCKTCFIDQVRWLTDGQWQLRTADGRIHSTSLLSSYTHPSVVVLQFALGRLTCRSIVMLSDSANVEAIRRLRVGLRTRRSGEDDEIEAL